MNAYVRFLEWIARGDGPSGPWLRLGLGVVAIWLWFFFGDRKDGSVEGVWWVPAVLTSTFLVVPFGLWRFWDRRRRGRARRDKMARRLDLG
jgi:hypothetical protein